MKKLLITAMLLVAAAFSMVGCGSKEETATSGNGEVTKTEDENAAIKVEICKFVNEDIPSIAKERDNAVAIYNKFFEENSNLDQTAWLKSLKEEAMVDYEVYLQSLKNMTYENQEVNDLKELYYNCASYQYEAIKDVVIAFSEVDSAYLEAAGDMVDTSKTYLRKYNVKLVDLCVKYGITINGNVDTATDSDAEQ